MGTITLNVYEVRYIRNNSESTISVMSTSPEGAVEDARRYLKANYYSDADIIEVKRRTKSVIYYKTPASKPRKRWKKY